MTGLRLGDIPEEVPSPHVIPDLIREPQAWCSSQATDAVCSPRSFAALRMTCARGDAVHGEILRAAQDDMCEGWRHAEHIRKSAFENRHSKIPNPHPAASPARTMAAKSAALRLAPPIRPPSTSGLDTRSAALPGFMLPPYRMAMSLAWAPN